MIHGSTGHSSPTPLPMRAPTFRREPISWSRTPAQPSARWTARQDSSPTPSCFAGTRSCFAGLPRAAKRKAPPPRRGRTPHSVRCSPPMTISRTIRVSARSSTTSPPPSTPSLGRPRADPSRWESCASFSRSSSEAPHQIHRRPGRCVHPGGDRSQNWRVDRRCSLRASSPRRRARGAAARARRLDASGPIALNRPCGRCSHGALPLRDTAPLQRRQRAHRPVADRPSAVFRRRAQRADPDGVTVVRGSTQGLLRRAARGEHGLTLGRLGGLLRHGHPGIRDLDPGPDAVARRGAGVTSRAGPSLQAASR